MAKIRKNNNKKNMEQDTASYFKHLADYVNSGDLTYDTFKKDVYDNIREMAIKGLYTYTLPLKIKTDRSFVDNKMWYGELFKRLRGELSSNGFDVKQVRNNFIINWQ